MNDWYTIPAFYGGLIASIAVFFQYGFALAFLCIMNVFAVVGFNHVMRKIEYRQKTILAKLK